MFRRARSTRLEARQREAQAEIGRFRAADRLTPIFTKPAAKIGAKQDEALPEAWPRGLVLLRRVARMAYGRALLEGRLLDG